MSFPSIPALATFLIALPALAGPPAAWEGWGALMGEPELDAAIEEALAQSASVSASHASARVRAMGTRLSRAARHPSVTVRGALRGGREQKASNGFVAADVEPWEVGGAVRLDLDVFGALRAQARGAFQAEELAGFELRNHELAWAAAMSRLLVQLRYRQHEQDARKGMVNSLELSRDWARNRTAAGLISASELDAYESRLLQSRQDQVAASQELEVLAAQWTYLAGNQPIPPARPPAQIAELPAAEQLHTWVMNRPDVQAARAAWLGADYQAAASRKSRYPSLAAVATAQGEGPSPVDDPEEWTAWAGLQLELPLWNPEDQARASRDREQARVEEATYRDVILAGLNELRQAYARRSHAESAWTFAAERAARARGRLATAQRKFDQELIMLTDAENARHEWLAAANRAEQARSLMLTHHIDLIQAAGGPGAVAGQGPK